MEKITRFFDTYGEYIKNVVNKISNQNIYYIILGIIILIVIYVILSVTLHIMSEKSYENWIPIFHFFKLGRSGIHDLYSIIMLIESIIIIPYPHTVDKVFKVAPLIKNSKLIIIFLILEIIVAYIFLIVKYVIKKNSIRIVK